MDLDVTLYAMEEERRGREGDRERGGREKESVSGCYASVVIRQVIFLQEKLSFLKKNQSFKES